MSIQYTADVQAESLLRFMSEMGYQPARWNGGWVTDNPNLNGNVQLSTRTAIRLHNLTHEGWVEDPEKPNWFMPEGKDINIRVTAYGVNKLLSSKIVEQVKFQPARNQRNGLLFPTNENANYVKFIDKRYAALYGYKL